MLNNNAGDGNLNVVITHADGSSRIIVFSATGLKYYEKAVGGGNVLKWQYAPSQ